MLQEVIKQEIENLKKGKVDKRVDSFVDYKNKYAVLKPAVKVEISLSQGIVATIDVSDYFEKEIN